MYGRARTILIRAREPRGQPAAESRADSKRGLDIDSGDITRQAGKRHGRGSNNGDIIAAITSRPVAKVSRRYAVVHSASSM
jgi:hypothetical protein